VEEINIIEGTLVKYKSAWLITWDWNGDHAKVDDFFVAILDYRYPAKTIKRFVELIYTNRKFALHEQLAYAKRRSANSYPAEFGFIEVRASKDSGLPDKVTWTGKIVCGGNPWLFARMVRDIVAYVDKDGREHLIRQERIHPVSESGKNVSDWFDCEIIR
jgi:hypothetical protein